MKKKLLFLVPVIGLAGFSFLSEKGNISAYHLDGIEGVEFSSNPLPAKTGAPGEGNCTDCHTGSVMSADGVVDFTLSGGPNYIPGETYPITISTVGGSKNGFEMVILDDSDNQAGSFTAGTGSSVVESDGKQYIRQSESTGVTSWSFSWTAPSEDMGNLTAYYAMNKADNDGTTAGDEIFLGTSAILPVSDASIYEDELDNAFTIYFNDLTRELNLSYSLFEDAKVVLNIQDLSGRLIEYYDFGNQNSGEYQQVVPVTRVDKDGVYLLSLFVNNRVLNRKLMLK